MKTGQVQRPAWLMVTWKMLLVFAFVKPVMGQVISRSFTEPVEMSEVAAAEPGVIARIHIKEGQQVLAGEALAQLNCDALEQSLRIAELRAKSTSKVDAARANLQMRQRQKEAIQPLLQSGHANPAEVFKAVLDHETALSELQLAQEEVQQFAMEVERIKAQLRQRTITSPIDGIITEVHHRAGEYVSTNDPQFATVVQLDRLRVRFYLLEQDVVKLQRGQIVPVRLGVNSEIREASIDFVSPVTDPDSGTARVDVMIQNKDLAIRSGTYCQWELPLSQPNEDFSLIGFVNEQ